MTDASIRRRSFLTLLGGAAAACRWQQGRSKTIGFDGSEYWTVAMKAILSIRSDTTRLRLGLSSASIGRAAISQA
jgi:hypothetical protein